MPILLSRTERSLIARGIPSQTAANLCRAGHTVASLRSENSLEKLISLGIPRHAAEKLLSGRPPIPAETLTKLLYDNKWRCCVCRDEESPIVVHHIVSWAVSRSHAAENLAVLCPNDHARAHQREDLGRNLTAADLRYAKQRWEKEVKVDDTLMLRLAAQTVGEYWHYFNVPRLIEIAHHQRLSLQRLRHFESAKAAGILDVIGTIIPEERDNYCAYTGRHSRLRYWFMRDLFLSVLDKLSIENISDRLDRSDLGITLIPNDIIYVEGAHTFRRISKSRCGEGQETNGTRTANHVRVVYTFDRWYATSSSAHTQWLSGRTCVGSFCRIGSIERDAKTLVLKCTVLAICQQMPDMKNRSYASEPSFAGFYYGPGHFDERGEDESGIFELPDDS